MADVAALVLAAGSGRRFLASGGSGPKVLAHLDGRPLLDHVLQTAAEAGLDPIIVVLSPEHAALPDLRALTDRAVRTGEVRTVVNPEASRGMGSSLTSGLDALAEQDRVRACVVLLADQPRIEPAVVARVVEEWRRTGRPARANYEDGPGHPVLLPRSTWSTVVQGLQDTGRGPDEGARGMLADLGAVPVDVAGPVPADVDVPADLDRAGGSA
jgi:CTP:molybdopterin cytidylyltransferase MocA